MTARRPVDGRGTRCGHRIRKQRLRRRQRWPAVAADRRGRAVDRRGHRGRGGHRAAAGQRQPEGGQVPGHQAATTVRAGAGAGAVPAAAQPVSVVAAARAVHDHAVQGAQPARVHQRGRRQARDPVAHAGAAASHPAGPAPGLQHARGHLRAVRRLLAGRQRVLLRQAPQVFQLGTCDDVGHRHRRFIYRSFPLSPPLFDPPWKALHVRHRFCFIQPWPYGVRTAKERYRAPTGRRFENPI